MSYSLYKSLDKYGFSSEEQKNALKALMVDANILEPNETISDRFPEKTSFNDFAADMLKFVNLTQTNFFRRSGIQERWEVKAEEWMEQNISKKMSSFTILGLKEEKLPSLKEIDLLCILGSTKPSMQNRLAYSEALLSQGYSIKKVCLVSGERYINLKVDGSNSSLSSIALEYKLKS